MAFWEFLIQKEGDRSWLPLDSTVEILEGRYRVVARSSRLNAPVEIRVVQNAASETPPIRRIQKRTGQTNADGLIVIIPFTRLSAGEWELRCTGDLMADLMGESWQYGVQLQVLPLEPEDWEPDWQEAAAALNQEEALPIAMATATPVDVIGATESGEVSTAAPAPEAPQVAEPLEPIEPPALPNLQLSLERDSFVVSRGQPLILTGQAEALMPAEPAAAINGKLRVRLFDPQTARLLVDKTQPLMLQGLPAPFSLAVALPPDCDTYLILGELTLHDTAIESSVPPALATQSFSVTTDLLELLEAIANAFPEADSLPQSSSSDSVSAALLTVPRMVQPVQFRPVTPQPLPPLLRSPEPADASQAVKERSLHLPDFGVSSSSASDSASDPASDSVDDSASDSAAAPAPDQATAAPVSSAQPANFQPQPARVEIPDLKDISDITEEDLSPGRADSRSDRPTSTTDLAPTLQAAALDDALPPTADTAISMAASIDPSVDWDSVDRPHLWQRAEAEPSATPEDNAFRALNLQERFLERLQALASDAELAEWLAALETPLLTADSSAEPAQPAGIFIRRQQNSAIGRDAELASQEIVLEDEPLLSASVQAAQSEEPRSGFHAFTETPLSTPWLEVPMDELVSGQTINVSIKLADPHSRIYAKLWTRDRQSRTLLDGPHWLMDFVPDGMGNLIGKTQLMVPFGCLEVQLEAIAIDMTTQRESDKISVIRSVIPPDLKVTAIDELGSDRL